MHLSSHTWMRDEPLERTCERLARLGYESVELYYGRHPSPDAAAIAPVLAAHGLRCWGAVMWPTEDAVLLSADAAQRAAFVAYAQAATRFVAALGGEIVVVVPGFGRGGPAASAQQEWTWAVEGLQAIHETAVDLGVRVALEPLNRFETHFLNRVDQALALCEAVGPSCGICLDAFHANVEEPDPCASIVAAGPRLFDFHVADSNRLAPGMGHYDWPRVLDALARAGYEGGLAVEFVPYVDRIPRDGGGITAGSAAAAESGELARLHDELASGSLDDALYEDLLARSAQVILPLLRA